MKSERIWGALGMRCDSITSKYNILQTNTANEAYKALEKVNETLDLVRNDTYQWKWAIIILHNCVQCFMVLCLEGTNQVDVIKDKTKDKKRIKAHLTHIIEDWKEPQLDDFLSLYRKVKVSLSLKNELDVNIVTINDFRNDFIHYFPKGWSLFTDGLPAVFHNILYIIEMIILRSDRIIYKYNDNQKSELKRLIYEIKSKLSDMNPSYQSISTDSKVH